MYSNPYHNHDISQHSFLVTGGAGFIGSNLVEYLLKFGAGRVRVLDNFSTGFRKNIELSVNNPAFELIEGDIRDFQTCQQAVEGIDYISHQAALGSVPRSIEDPITTNAVNISGFLNVLTAARDANVKKMVYAASSSTYGDHPVLPKVEDQIGGPLSPYAVTKYVNELYGSVFSKVYGFHTIGLRYFNVFGPKQDPNGAYAAVIPLFMNAVLNNMPATINGDGQQSRDFTFVENAVEANIRAMLAPGINSHEAVNIAFGEQTTLNQLWNKINAIAGTQIQAKHTSERRGDIKHSLASIKKAATLFGYHPQTSLQQGLERTYEWYAGQQ